MPTDTFFHPDKLDEQKEEKQEEKKQEKKEETQKPQQQQPQQKSKAPQMNLLSTVFRLRRELHRAEEQRAKVRSRWRFRVHL